MSCSLITLPLPHVRGHDDSCASLDVLAPKETLRFEVLTHLRWRTGIETFHFLKLRFRQVGRCRMKCTSCQLASAPSVLPVLHAGMPVNRIPCSMIQKSSPSVRVCVAV